MEREGNGPLTPLTAFGPHIGAHANDNVYTGKAGDTKWTIVVGGGKANGLESDGHIAVELQHVNAGQVEAMCFGGKTLRYHGVRVESTAEDVFAVIADRKVTRLVTMLVGK